ncbi:MAG: type II toxin-antitoxin system HicB family antitoxin [Solirubrobacterales bacterium]|nr:type II toxin-antitoxin system HicB family antitoxin [Solirubrobacterales bacterium]
MSEYLVIYEPGSDGWSAYVPDLPGCVSTGTDRLDAEAGIREAISLHLEGLRAEGLHVPSPSTTSGVVTAA